MDNLLVHWSAQGRNAQVRPSFPEKKNIVGQNRGFAGFLYLDGDTVKAHFLVLLNQKTNICQYPPRQFQKEYHF